MVQAPLQTLTLEEFLKLPETKPSSEFIDGRVTQKSTSKTRHSRLQGKLVSTINDVGERSQVAAAFPELRCTFGGRSIVPDVVVLGWHHLQFDQNGELVDDVLIPPDWTIEILSPEQSTNKVTGNILHCLKYGCQLGWLIDPEDRSVLIFRPKQEPEIYYGNSWLVGLEDVPIDLTVEAVFDWLRMAN